ncbi:MAG: hypothetical protein JWM11_7215 [Planctomycetaceae bacterium]|nr:hypothetical protein [Planctomycetaceae bacterium]
MRQLSALRNVPFALLISIGCLGCGGGTDRPKLGKITGTVTYKGKAIPEGEITFYPENGRSATGQISSGEITDVHTFDPDDGLPVGKLKVTVSAYNGPKDDMYKPPKLITPEKYNNVKTTDLSVDIEPGENSKNFELKD